MLAGVEDKGAVIIMSPDRESKLRPIHGLFEWLNAFSGTDDEMMLEDIKRFFTPQATLTLNGQSICRGWDGQLAHGKDLQAKMRSWRFHLPFEITVVEGDTVVGYYTCDFVSRDGVPGKVLDMCIWTLKGGKIDSILENVVFEGAAVEVQSVA